jgi:acetylornithine deacetylase/succinyl-diaminopimelate desuccinylase family protein
MVRQEQMEHRIVEAISSYHDEILDFTKVLVSIPTENPPGTSYLACVEAMAGKLHDMGLEATVIEVPVAGEQTPPEPDQGRPPYPRYCLLSFYGQGDRTVYFHGHYDVVPASSQAQFCPYVKDGHLFGRGAADMKSGLAAMMWAVKAIKACGIELRGRIGLTFVPDEETGGALGSQYLAEAGLLGQDGMAMFMPEPTGGVIWNANRGAISLRVTVKGKPAHVCTHYEGVNAFEHMLAVGNALLDLKTEVEPRETAFKIEPQAARRSILLLGGRCEGGINFNTVPATCSFTIDRRTNPEEVFETEKQRLFTLFDRLRGEGIDLDVEVLQEGTSASVAEDDPVAQALAGSVEAITGRRAAFEMCPGILETRFYGQQGIPGLAYGPGLLSVSHGPHECVRLKDIYDCAAIYALSAARLLAAQ